MYEKLFNLQKNPFNVTPDPNWLLMTPTHRESLSGLLYAVYRRKGFVVLTGEAGTGKTVLLRALMRSSKAAQFSVVLNPTLTRDEFMEMVLLDFGYGHPREQSTALGQTTRHAVGNADARNSAGAHRR